MSMSRKDFEAVATALGGVERQSRGVGLAVYRQGLEDALVAVRTALLPVFLAANPNFDAERFTQRVFEVASRD